MLYVLFRKLIRIGNYLTLGTDPINYSLDYFAALREGRRNITGIMLLVWVKANIYMNDQLNRMEENKFKTENIRKWYIAKRDAFRKIVEEIFRIKIYYYQWKKTKYTVHQIH
jgi:hypothetical protein